MKHKFNIWILLTVGGIAIAIGFGIPFRTEGQRETKPKDDERSLSKLLAGFPVALFEAPLPLNEAERASRTTKSRRYDGRSGMVMQDEPQSDGSNVLFDAAPSRKTLPIEESTLVITAEAVDAKAFLSNDKLNVYSEFRFRVDEVIKDESAKVKVGAYVMADRIGGQVLYPNGKKMLYYVSGLLLPRLQNKYLLFLAGNGASENYVIVSGFEFDGSKAYPLNREDLLPQMDTLDESSLKHAIRREIRPTTKP